MSARRAILQSFLLVLGGCVAPGGNDYDGWRPFRGNPPIVSPGSILDRPPLRDEDGNIWPDPEPPRTTLTDPDAVARGVPNFRPL